MVTTYCASLRRNGSTQSKKRSHSTMPRPSASMDDSSCDTWLAAVMPRSDKAGFKSVSAMKPPPAVSCRENTARTADSLQACSSAIGSNSIKQLLPYKRRAHSASAMQWGKQGSEDYPRVPKFSPYGKTAYACARVTETVKLCPMGPNLRYRAVQEARTQCIGDAVGQARQ
jgi:hypothetical protein